MREGREIVVGVVIILAVAVVAAGTLFLKGARFGQEITRVDVLAGDVGQLMEGNDVKFRGVDIGQVQSITVEPGGNAVRIALELDGQIELTRDAVAIIAPESLFGDWETEILSRERFPRYDYYEVEEGRRDGGVPVIGGYAIPDISRLTASMEAVADNVGALSARFERAFSEETADALSQAIRDLQVISEDVKNLIEQQATTFENVSANVERAAGEIGDAAATGRTTLERIDGILASGELDSLLVNLEAASRNLEEVTANLGGSTAEMDRTMALVDSTLLEVRAITGGIRAGEGSLGMLFADSSLYLQAERTLGQLDSLLVDLRANPGRYINLSIF